MFNNILKSDVLFKTKNVSVLKPNIKKGAILFHKIHNDQINVVDQIKLNGLKSGKQLKREGIEFGRRIYHDSIFFKAPFVSPNKINYDSIQSELISLYPDLFDSKYLNEIDMSNIAVIRVDPNETYVFSSEIRVNYYGEEIYKNLNKSRISLIDYFKQISNNCKPYYFSEKQPVWNLITRDIYYFSKNYQLPKFFSTSPIERNSEILVARDIIHPNELAGII